MPRNLVTRVATRLMETTASTVAEVNEQVLAELVEHLDIDCAFLRHNDHKIRVSKLVAIWPPRRDRSVPDPTSVAHFSTADPVLALCGHGKKLTIIQPEASDATVARWVAAAQERWGPDTAKFTSPSVVSVPLISGGVTTGQLTCTKFKKKKWRTEELNTIQTVASLLAQLQARITAEAKLRNLAEHDDLTGLHNRRALMAHLSERLAAGKPGPVPVLYLDLDRLKSINDYLGHTAGDWYLQDIRRTASDESRRQKHDGPLGRRRVRRCAGSVHVDRGGGKDRRGTVRGAARSNGARRPHDHPHRQRRRRGRRPGTR